MPDILQLVMSIARASCCYCCISVTFYVLQHVAEPQSVSSLLKAMCTVPEHVVSDGMQ